MPPPLPSTDSISWSVLCGLSAVKLLLLWFPYSTDFDVHRNWLAITGSLPLSEWYRESTSEWTLDYPPFFALFEWVLAQAAKFVDEDMLVVSDDFRQHAAPALILTTVVFQKLTVVVSDVVLWFAVEYFCGIWRSTADASSNDADNESDIPFGTPLSQYGSPYKRLAALLLVFCNAGLLLVDHVHFQYNGFLFGVFVLSLACIRRGHLLSGAILFAILLNLKHIFLFVAPVYFIFLLRAYCMTSPHPSSQPRFEGWEQFSSHERGSRPRFDLCRFVVLGASVVAVFAISFGPIVASGQLWHCVQRLFPFKRGLSHACWAPNVWALYNALDLVLAHVLDVGSSSTTRGLVQEVEHVVLPSVPPMVTFVLTFVSMLPCLYVLWRRPHPRVMVAATAYCAMCSYMLGWHVHEKAILMSTVPLVFSCLDMVHSTGLCFFLLLTSSFSLLPLLHEPIHQPLKCAVMVAFILCCRQVLHLVSFSVSRVSRVSLPPHLPGLLPLERVYLWGLVPLQVVVWSWPFLPPSLSSLEFAPLLLVSVYCALGHVWAWPRVLALVWRTGRAVEMEVEVEEEEDEK